MAPTPLTTDSIVTADFVDGQVVVTGQGRGPSGESVEFRAPLGPEAATYLMGQIQGALEVRKQVADISVIQQADQGNLLDFDKLDQLHRFGVTPGLDRPVAAELIRRYQQLAEPLATAFAASEHPGNRLLAAHMLQQLGRESAASESLRRVIVDAQPEFGDRVFPQVSAVLAHLHLDAEDQQRWILALDRYLETGKNSLEVYYAADEEGRELLARLGQGPVQLLSRVSASSLSSIDQVCLIDLISAFDAPMVDQALVAMERNPEARPESLHWASRVLVEQRDRLRTLREVQRCPEMERP